MVDELDFLEVQNDLRDVLNNTGKRAELMLSASDAHACDGSAFEGAKQDAAQGVAECVTEAGLDRLSNECDVVRILRVIDTLEGIRNLEMPELDDLFLFVL